MPAQAEADLSAEVLVPSPGRILHRRVSKHSTDSIRNRIQHRAAECSGGSGAGLAGGFLGSLLFRGMGYGSTGMGGGGGIGLLDILCSIGGVGLMVYRMFKRRQEGGSGGTFLRHGRRAFRKRLFQCQQSGSRPRRY